MASILEIINLKDYMPVFSISSNKLNLFQRNGKINIEDEITTNLFSNIEKAIKEEYYDNTINTEVEGCPEWVNRNIAVGELGENIVLNFFKSQTSQIKHTSKTNSKAGYDILVNNIYMYEVKTTRRSDNVFYISINELKKAHQFKELYYIFYIQIQESEKKISGYIIKNPISLLSIDFNEISKIYQTINSDILPCSFIVKIKENILDEFIEIDMLEFLKG